VDPFEEIFKLIYAKLYDEWRGINEPSYQLEFFVGDRSPELVKRSITNLLDRVRRTWSGIFELYEIQFGDSAKDLRIDKRYYNQR